MYKEFNIETDKDLILLNYYIEKNEKNSVIELTIKDVESVLGTNRSKAYRCIKELEKLRVIEVSDKSNSKSKKTQYKYLLNENTDSRCKETKLDIPEYLNKYLDIYKKYLFEIDDSKIIDILNIRDLEKIQIDLFECIIKDSKQNAIKNPHKYSIISLQNTINDNIFTLDERKKSQNISLNINKNTAKNYTDNSEEEDWDTLTMLTNPYM